MTWKMERYTWVGDPVPPDSWETGFYAGAYVVDAALGGRYGAPSFAEELAGSCGLSLGTVRDRLEELVLEGKVRVEEIEYPSNALGPQILREHFTAALRALRRADFHIHAVNEAHIEAHHDGDIGNAFDDEGWTCDVCRDLVAHSNETMAVENVLREGEAEAASHFVTEVYKGPELPSP